MRLPRKCYATAGDRRRQQPDRLDAGGPVGLAAENLRLESSARRRQGDGHAEVDGGLEMLVLTLPGHRYHRPALKRAALCDAAQHMKAKKKPLNIVKPEELGNNWARLKTLKVVEPAMRLAGHRGERCGHAGR